MKAFSAKPVALLGLLLFLPVCFAGNPSTCRLRIRAFAEKNFLPGAEPFLLPAESKRYLLGALARTEEGKLLLVVNGYRWRHEDLHATLETLRDQEEIGDFTYLWIGELQIINPLGGDSIGMIRKVNDVAGLWKRHLASEGTHDNQLSHLEAALEENAPELLARNAKWFRFKKLSREGSDLHLMQELNRFIRRFEKHQKKGKVSDKDNYRHYLGNVVPGFLLKMEQVFADEKSFPTDSDREKAIADLVRSKLRRDAMHFFFSSLQNDGISSAALTTAQQTLEVTESAYPTDAEWRRFAELAPTLLDHINHNEVSTARVKALQEAQVVWLNPDQD